MAVETTALAVTLIGGAISGGTSLLYAALGETVSERAGVINVAPRAPCWWAR